MKYELSNTYYKGFVPDDEIETGKDYLYCPLNKPPKRVRITGYSTTPSGAPFLFYWHEVKPDGALEFESEATLGLFKPFLEPKKLAFKMLIPMLALRGMYTAPLRRGRIPAECRV